MPSRATYILKIHGRLTVAPGSDPQTETDFKKDFEELFPKPVAPAPDGNWPAGFLLEGYQICHWEPRVESACEGKYTLLDFRAEINSFKTGQLFDNRNTLLEDVAWFYSYAIKKWHRDLRDQLVGFNDKWRSVILDEVWFRDWQWYCGNGGGK